jgi:hypothetical protein
MSLIKERLHALRAPLSSPLSVEDPVVSKVHAAASTEAPPVSQYWQANNDMGSGIAQPWGVLDRTTDK